MTDRLIIKGMTFYGWHGVLPHEKEMGQPFVVDLVLYLDLDQAARRDDLAYTVDYSRVFQLVKQIVEGERFNLIDALAGAIADRIIEGFPVKGARIQVRKPMAPVGGLIDYVAVDVRRWRRN